MMLRLFLLFLFAYVGWASDSLPATDSTPVSTATPPSSLDSPLAPVKTDSPRDTLKSFMDAMDHYVAARQTDARLAATWLDDAVRCLDCSSLPMVDRDIAARDSAIALKEVIDRVITIDYSKVPNEATLQRWRLRSTEITVLRIDNGERKGEYTISADSVQRARGFFARVKHLPLLAGSVGGGLEPSWDERYVPDNLKQQIVGVAYWQWLLLGLLIFVGIVLRQVTRFIGFLIKRLTARTSATWDDELVEVLTSPATYLATTGVWF
ncbi:MAG: hypothetical protein AAB263_16680, partial [Planctomycetota bacterium]